MDWEDVWRIKGFVEVSARQAKTRQRRLVPMLPALAAWLAPCRRSTGRIWKQTPSTQGFINAVARHRESLGIAPRKNGMRHSFISYRLAATRDENAVALEAGNTPGIIHSNYRQLCTPKTARAWFNVQPAKSAVNIVELPGVRSA